MYFIALNIDRVFREFSRMLVFTKLLKESLRFPRILDVDWFFSNVNSANRLIVRDGLLSHISITFMRGI